MLGNQYGLVTPWTPAMDALILTMWDGHRQVDISALTGRSPKSIRKRAMLLGLSKRCVFRCNTPTFEDWLAVASEVGRERGLTAGAIMGHSKARHLSAARWEAWRRLMAMSPQYTLAGLARATGWDRTAILYAKKQLAKSVHSPEPSLAEKYPQA